MKIKFPAWAVLLTIAVVAGLLLAFTNGLTQPVIADQAAKAAEESRRAVLGAAQSFEEIAVPEGAQVDWCYAGMADGEIIGYVAQATVNGYVAEVEVIVGVGTDGAITGVSVGGPSFSETAGLGANTKNESFRGQFAGKVAPLRVIKSGQGAAEDTVDAITAATISSTAVTNAVNTAAEFIAAQQ